MFESTADLTQSGATNRRVFQFDRGNGKLTLLSRSRFGTNQAPRIRKRRFVVWESTANLTGNNPERRVGDLPVRPQEGLTPLEARAARPQRMRSMRANFRGRTPGRTARACGRAARAPRACGSSVVSRLRTAVPIFVL